MLRKKYLRDENNHPIGLVIIDNDCNVGWSKCHPKDQFNKKMANKIAENRYNYYKENPQEVAQVIGQMSVSFKPLKTQIIDMITETYLKTLNSVRVFGDWTRKYWIH